MKRRVIKQPPTFAGSHSRVQQLNNLSIDKIIYQAQNPRKFKRMAVAKTFNNSSQDGSEVFSSRNLATGATTAVDWRNMKNKIN